MEHLFPYPKMGHSFTEILLDPLTRKLLGHDAVHAEKTPFVRGVTSRLTFLLSDPMKHLSFLKIGYTSLEAFLQANATGPPLDFDSEPIIFPDMYRDENFPNLIREIFQDLSVDGDAIYAFTPRVELFWLAKVVMSNTKLADAGFNGRRARLRVNFWHQKLLQEKSDTLQNQLYTDGDVLEEQLFKRLEMKAAAAEEHFVEFLLERAAIRIYYGDDVKAREDLARAASIRDFHFALTGALGKRTKFQDQDISQLVVLARSREVEPEPYSSRKSSRVESASRKSSAAEARSPRIAHRPVTPTSSIAVESVEALSPSPLGRKSLTRNSLTNQPENVPLNDDTLHENIQFTKDALYDEESLTRVQEASSLPSALVNLDPGDQPLLFPVDSIILLSTASSISNTSPADGLTREETLPYASRVLEGGSSNWQVYTQALLVRSRIEGYKSRTAERGLLQLQALVDQVIAETEGTNVTTKKGDDADSASSKPTTFLPRLKISEAATVAERLKYIYQLSPPLRWELEAELAQRWTQMGGLRTALEIYERLQMQAEVALCLAATDREAKAVELLKSILFEDSIADTSTDASTIPELRSTQPTDAPRLLSILGDILAEPKYYTLAWTLSNQRYARAQRSLGRYYTKQRDPAAAAEAYKLALSITRLDNSTWFALGCIQLELEDWAGAVESFTRVVQLEDQDAEGWSNLAIALLKLPPASAPVLVPVPVAADDEVDKSDSDPVAPTAHSRTRSHEALRALRRAANLKREDARIWDNYLTVAASIPPSQGTPWNEIIQAMSQIIQLRGPKEGEGAVDLSILRALIEHVTSTIPLPEKETSQSLPTILPPSVDTDTQPQPTNGTSTTSNTATTTNDDATVQHPPPRTPFLATALQKLIDTQIQPIASTPALFLLLSQVSLWRHRPLESLTNTERAWRAATSSPGAYDSTPVRFAQVVDVTLKLVDAYRTLGERERERTGGPVEKAWRFKARAAVRSVVGRGREGWEGSESMDRLEEVLGELK